MDCFIPNKLKTIIKPENFTQAEGEESSEIGRFYP